MHQSNHFCGGSTVIRSSGASLLMQLCLASTNRRPAYDTITRVSSGVCLNKFSRTGQGNCRAITNPVTARFFMHFPCCYAVAFLIKFLKISNLESSSRDLIFIENIKFTFPYQASNQSYLKYQNTQLYSRCAVH